MPAYVLAELTIEDRAEYARYEAAFMDVFKNFRGELLVVDEKPVVVEGAWPHTRTVLIRFPDAAEAERWYRSPEYETLIALRQGASRGSLIAVEGA